MADSPDQQTRLPGVRYRKIVLERDETTVIDGVPSTRKVQYAAWEPVPPRDWDELILRGVTGVTIGVTALAVVATTASVGGLLTNLIHPFLAYCAGAVFTMNWLACMAVEWLQRGDDRVWIPRTVGWIALAVSMGAVGAYGHTLNQLAAGVIGACIDLLSKGLWTLVMGLYRVPLDEGVRHWLTEQEQKLASKALLAIRLRRLNSQAAYLRAVGGREIDAAEAITAAAQRPDMSKAPSLPVKEPAPAPTPPTAPLAPHAPPSAPPAPPAPPSGQDTDADTDMSGQNREVRQMTLPPIASICRQLITADPKVTDADLMAEVKRQGHPGRANLADTVRRTALRIDPARKANAS